MQIGSGDIGLANRPRGEIEEIIAVGGNTAEEGRDAVLAPILAHQRHDIPQ